MRLPDLSSRLGGFMGRVARRGARENAQFHAFSHRDFRHSFAIQYLRNGRGSIYDLQGERGHRTITITERYLPFLTPDQVKAAKSTMPQRGTQVLRPEAST